jgi:hypothetical protein
MHTDDHQPWEWRPDEIVELTADAEPSKSEVTFTIEWQGRRVLTIWK